MRLFIACLIAISLTFPAISHAQSYAQTYAEGIITAIDISDDQKTTVIKLITGIEKGSAVVISQPLVGSDYEQAKFNFKVGSQVVVTKVISGDQSEYFISDQYRLNILIWLGLAYAAMIVILSRMKGLRSLLGLAFSFVVLTQFMIPRIMEGHNPIVVTVTGAIVIMTVTLYLAHGLSKKTTVSLIGTMGSLIIASLLGHLVIQLAGLSGLGSEEAMFLLMGDSAGINIRGLLLSGIIISALGVIDDLTVTQTAIVYELKAANPKLTIAQLYKKALNVGKDHIASVTNTLILAYAGASLPLFLLFYQNSQLPAWVAINSELIAEEVTATLVGSLGLVLSVPITTLLAAHAASREKRHLNPSKTSKHVHGHFH